MEYRMSAARLRFLSNFRAILKICFVRNRGVICAATFCAISSAISSDAPERIRESTSFRMSKSSDWPDALMIDTDIDRYYTIGKGGEKGSQGGYLTARRSEKKNRFYIYITGEM